MNQKDALINRFPLNVVSCCQVLCNSNCQKVIIHFNWVYRKQAFSRTLYHQAFIMKSECPKLLNWSLTSSCKNKVCTLCVCSNLKIG